MKFLNEISPLLNLIVIVVLPFVFVLMKSYFQSYITESAKSSVQKRDIEELTQKVEAVKAIYTRENERIKYQLNQILSLKERHRNEERNALMKFHAAYIHWIYLLQGVNLTDYNFVNLNELLQKKLSLNDFFYNIHVERANVLLIVNNAEIIEMTYKLIGNLVSYKAFIEKNLMSLENLLSRNKSLIDSFLKRDYDNPNHRSLMLWEAEQEKSINIEIEDLRTEFNDKRVPEFLKCRHPCDEFATLAKQYLLSINE